MKLHRGAITVLQENPGEIANPERAIVKYSSDWRAAWKIRERSFRNWRSAGIIRPLGKRRSVSAGGQVKNDE
jgi:hypothetical protein